MGIDVLSNDERRMLLLSVGTHKGRRPLSPVEVAGLFEKATVAGSTLAECAAAASLEGTTWVGRFLRLLKLPDTVTHLVDWGGGAGTIGLSNASEIARLGNPAEEESIVQTVLASRLTVSEVRQVVQLRKRSNRPIDACLEVVLKMRPRVEKRHVYIGAITIPGLKQKLTGMTQQQRDEIFAHAVSVIAKGYEFPLKKLGTDRFTLVGGPDLGKLISDRKDTLEQDINENLSREIH